MFIGSTQQYKKAGPIPSQLKKEQQKKAHRFETKDSTSN